MNTRIRQTLASMFSAAAVMFAVPLAASAQEPQAPMVVRVSRDAALARQTREVLRAAGVTTASAQVLVVQHPASARH